MISGVMDVVYRKGSSWYVVDYKTNADPYGLDQLYRDQLAAYRDSINQLLGVKVTAIHTYHIPLLKSQGSRLS